MVDLVVLEDEKISVGVNIEEAISMVIWRWCLILLQGFCLDFFKIP